MQALQPSEGPLSEPSNSFEGTLYRRVAFEMDPVRAS